MNARRFFGVLQIIVSIVILTRAWLEGVDTINIYIVLAMLCIGAFMQLSQKQ